MTKLCPRGKAAAKRKFKVYPSAYANAYASKICAGKIKDPSGVKRKDFRGSKAEGGLMEATSRLKRQGLKDGGKFTDQLKERLKKQNGKKPGASVRPDQRGPEKIRKLRIKKIEFKTGGRAGYRKGGGVCLRGMNRDAIGKNS
jgi:hypothetical protein